MWVLEDQVMRYDNAPYDDAPDTTRERWGDTKSSQGLYPYHAVCRDCDRQFNQEQMHRELGIDATLCINIDNKGEFIVEREESDDE